MRKRTKTLLRNIVKLLQIIWQEDKFLTIAYFATSALGAFMLYVVYFVYKLMIDAVAGGASLTPSSSLLLIIGTYLFFEYMSRFVNFTFNGYYFSYFIRAKLQNALTRHFMNKIASLDFAHLENGDTRNLIAKVEGTYSFRLPEILTKLNEIAYNAAALIFSLVIALQFSPIYFLLLALVSAPVYYLRSKYGNAAWSQFSANASSSNYIWYIRSLFTNFQTLSEMKIYGLRPYFIDKTKVLQDKILEDYRKPIRIYSILSTASFILIPVAIYFALTQFISGVAQGQYTIGDFTFFLNALFTFSGQISSILINFGSVTENALFLNDYFKLMEIENKITVPHNPRYFDHIQPRTIEFQNVSFTYPGAEKPSLTKVNLVIEKGEDVAIVGHNGAGKSTLIKLLFRFYDPSEGRILIDGVDLRDIDVDHWYQHIGVLFQDFARYYMTLRENIQFGNMQLDGEQDFDPVEKALFHAQGSELLQVLPGKYEQILGRWFEHGMELSGGQWQKVAIARAIYRDAPILILDEPTSAIDAEAEFEIFKNLKDIYSDKNLIFISHRFSTVRMAHKIIVLEGGRVVEQGTHQDLVNNNEGLYANYFKLQKRGYE